MFFKYNATGQATIARLAVILHRGAGLVNDTRLETRHPLSTWRIRKLCGLLAGNAQIIGSRVGNRFIWGIDFHFATWNFRIGGQFWAAEGRCDVISHQSRIICNIFVACQFSSGRVPGWIEISCFDKREVRVIWIVSLHRFSFGFQWVSGGDKGFYGPTWTLSIWFSSFAALKFQQGEKIVSSQWLLGINVICPCGRGNHAQS